MRTESRLAPPPPRRYKRWLTEEERLFAGKNTSKSSATSIMETEPRDKSELRVSASKDERGFLKKFLFNLQGPGPVLILISWLIATVVICVYADDSGRKLGVGLLMAFLTGYLFTLGDKK